MKEASLIIWETNHLQNFDLSSQEYSSEVYGLLWRNYDQSLLMKNP
jgi:hypothetical protein